MDIATRIILLSSALLSKNYFHFKKHPDVELTINQLVTKYGYPIETHRIITEDGYHLNTFRIRHGANSNKTNPDPVLLVHGTCGCAENFLILGPTQSLGYYLADMGFDVWLMNNRGNFHSRKHSSLNPDTNKKFWDFSFHEISVKDIPANIDYILKVTNKTKLGYIGHSQGTTDYFALVTTKTEYNDKISVGINLAPSAYLWRETAVTTLLAKHWQLLQEISEYLGLWELFPGDYNLAVKTLLRYFCSEINVLADFCALGFHLGSDTRQFDTENLQMLFQSSPARCASKVLVHYGQVINSGEFKQFDYGISKNMEIYGTPQPPPYDIRNITAPTAYFYSTVDPSSTEENILKMVSLTKNAIVRRSPFSNFSHVDYIIGRDIMQLVNKPVYEILLKYTT